MLTPVFTAPPWQREVVYQICTTSNIQNGVDNGGLRRKSRVVFSLWQAEITNRIEAPRRFAAKAQDLTTEPAGDRRRKQGCAASMTCAQ
jgi:hypothetical protein